jgi:hypothetical protein
MQNLEPLAAPVSMQGNHKQAALLFGAAEALPKGAKRMSTNGEGPRGSSPRRKE